MTEQSIFLARIAQFSGLSAWYDPALSEVAATLKNYPPLLTLEQMQEVGADHPDFTEAIDKVVDLLGDPQIQNFGYEKPKTLKGSFFATENAHIRNEWRNRPRVRHN